MTDQPQNSNAAIEQARLIRAGSDGELNAADQARFDAMVATDSEIAKRAEFEQGLRAACGKAMGQANGPVCPAGLRARVEQIAADSRTGQTAGSSDAEAMFDRVEAQAEQTRNPSFWAGPRSRMVVAVAATVLLSVSALLVWQSYGLSGSAALPANGQLWSASYRQQLAEFVTREHMRTGASEAAAKRKFVYTDAESAREWFVGLLGNELQLPALSQPVEAIEFKGAGKCGVPGAARGKSAHMRFEVTGADGSPIVVSVFVAPRSSEISMVEGKTYAIDMSACGIEGFSVLAWTDGIANYFLVADAGTNGCDETIKAIGRPEPSEKI